MFHTTIDSEFANQLLENKDLRFVYQRPEDAPTRFCGYAGFKELEFSDMPKPFRKNLVLVYRRIRESQPVVNEVRAEVNWSNELQLNVPTGKTITTELNPIRVFFYNADFDDTKYRIGLKYNESWSAQQATLAPHLKRDERILETFANSTEDLMAEWRDSAEVLPLNVHSPELTTKNNLKSVQAHGAIKAIILPNAKFHKPFISSHTHYYVVNEETVESVAIGFGGKQTRRILNLENEVTNN